VIHSDFHFSVDFDLLQSLANRLRLFPTVKYEIRSPRSVAELVFKEANKTEVRISADLD
jgi:hypothetical protein